MAVTLWLSEVLREMAADNTGRERCHGTKAEAKSERVFIHALRPTCRGLLKQDRKLQKGIESRIWGSYVVNGIGAAIFHCYGQSKEGTYCGRRHRLS